MYCLTSIIRQISEVPTCKLRSLSLYLIDGTWNETLDVLPLPKYLWECRAEGRSSLNSWEPHLSDVISVLEPKDTPGLIHSDTFLDAKDLAIEAGH